MDYKNKKNSKIGKKDFSNKNKRKNNPIRKRKPKLRDSKEFTRETAPGFVESFINLDGYAVTVFKSPIREDRLPAYFKKYKNNKYALISFEDLDKIIEYVNSTKCKDNRKKDIMNIMRNIRNPSLRSFFKLYCNTQSTYKKKDTKDYGITLDNQIDESKHEDLMILHAERYKNMCDRRGIKIPEEFAKYNKADVAEKFIPWAYDKIKDFNVDKNN